MTIDTVTDADTEAEIQIHGYGATCRCVHIFWQSIEQSVLAAEAN